MTIDLNFVTKLIQDIVVEQFFANTFIPTGLIKKIRVYLEREDPGEVVFRTNVANVIAAHLRMAPYDVRDLLKVRLDSEDYEWVTDTSVDDENSSTPFLLYFTTPSWQDMNIQFEVMAIVMEDQTHWMNITEKCCFVQTSFNTGDLEWWDCFGIQHSIEADKWKNLRVQTLV